MGTKSETVSYKVGVGYVRFTKEYVVRHTLIPAKQSAVPNIIGWSGPARVGSTALLFLLAGHPQVSRIYFQPQKTIMRQGGPAFELSSNDKLICMKEVYGHTYPSEAYDPISMLIAAGVPEEKINWIFLLRDPHQTFASWRHGFREASPSMFASTQKYTIDQYHSYRSKGISATPFVYELLKGQENRVITWLLSRLGLKNIDSDLLFDAQAIRHKLVPGQVSNRDYYEYNIKATYDRKHFMYNRNNYSLPVAAAKAIETACRKDYEDFYHLAAAEMKMWDVQSGS